MDKKDIEIASLKQDIKALNIRFGKCKYNNMRYMNQLQLYAADLRMIKNKLYLMADNIFVPGNGSAMTATKKYFKGGKNRKRVRYTDGEIKPQ